MPNHCVFVTLLALTLTSAAASLAKNNSTPAAAKELAALQGTWIAQSAEVVGMPMDPENLKLVMLRIDGEKYEWQVNDLGRESGNFKLVPGKNPKAFDLQCIRGNNEGKTFPAIYALDGDTLKVCYELGDGKRPISFKAPANTFLLAVTYTRQKKSDPLPFGR